MFVYRVAVLLLVAFSWPALASDTGLYLGAGGGSIKFSDQLAGFTTARGTASSGSLTVGYRLSKELTIEAMYSDASDVSVPVTAVTGPSSYDISRDTLSYKSTSLSIVPTFNVGRSLSLFARGGLNAWSVDNEHLIATYTQDMFGNYVPTSSTTAIADDRGVSSLYGGGMDWRPLSGITVRASYDVHQSIGPNSEAAKFAAMSILISF